MVETLLLRGYLAADRGALAEAGQYFARAERLKPPDLDWPWEIALARAELSELSGGWFSAELAEYHYRRAIARVESFRSTAPSSSAHLVSSHRGPYDGLIALFARAGRWRDALAVILELDAGDVLRGPSASRSKPAPAVAVDEVLSAWRGRDLVIVIAPAQRQIEPNRERAYRLRIANGQVTGEDVGSAREAQRWAWKLFVDPEDRAAAQELGRMIVPPGSSRETLDVLPIGPLGRVPLAALRDGDGSLILQRRPLARILAVRPRQGAAGAGAGSPVVIADPQGDLFSAAFEGHIVAGALGGAARLSGAWTASRATRDQLWAARGADLLHIAAHVGGDRHVLSLADGEVTPAEIVQRGLAPRLAVLASCGSAAVWSEEGWGSLASAFLAAGTSTVVATDRSVDDGWSHSLMRDFYTQPDWRSDPARALAAAQQRMAAGASPDERAEAARVWAAFFVLRGPPTVSQPARQISAAW